MKKLLLLIAVVCVAFHAGAAKRFVVFEPSENAVRLDNSDVEIEFDVADWPGVLIAVDNLKNDLKAVTGSDRAGIVVASADKSKLASRYADVARRLKGKWEQYEIFVDDSDRLVIIGSDKRGTIYGVYELSRQLGVSPWYWWADVPVMSRDRVYVLRGSYTDGEPKVRYRGIFINDEWPSFGSWCGNMFGGINSKVYEKVFELLLRLKANYLWPAMWASAFNEDDPASPELADRYGIVMGTSHHEPMMRAHKEYTSRRESIGAWDYNSNKKNIDRFFREGVERNKHYENIITIGMRGDGDVAMGGDDKESMRTLANVVMSQRRIIEKAYGKKAGEVPQLWAIFTEVQRYYDAGFTVPDDVTLLFCDNNWGYIRRTGNERERSRKGGMGLYYHIDMNGGPWNDRWVNTTTAAKLREQLNLAYRTGLDRIWIINVGDIKPKEMPIDFIMEYAWNPDRIGPEDVVSYMENWARGIFGAYVSEDDVREIAAVVTEYSNLNLQRKPEVNVPGIYSAATGEAGEMLRRWECLEQRVQNLSSRIPQEIRDAFYQLVEYPAIASAGVARIYLYATLHAYDPTVADYERLAQELFDRDRRMEHRYNNEIAGGKWRGMMQDRHIGYTRWSMPEENKLPEFATEVRKGANTFSATKEIGIKAKDYSRTTAGPDSTKWIFLPGVGRDEGDMGVWPVTAPSRPDGSGPALEYDVVFDCAGRHTLAIGILPTNDVNPGRGLRLGVRVDDAMLQTVDARQGYHDLFNEYTAEHIAASRVLKPLPPAATNIYLSGHGKPRRSEVFDNMRWLSVDIDVPSAGQHTLKIVMIDPEIVVEKLVVDPDNRRPSYLGPRA